MIISTANTFHLPNEMRATPGENCTTRRDDRFADAAMHNGRRPGPRVPSRALALGDWHPHGWRRDSAEDRTEIGIAIRAVPRYAGRLSWTAAKAPAVPPQGGEGRRYLLARKPFLKPSPLAGGLGCSFCLHGLFRVHSSQPLHSLRGWWNHDSDPVVRPMTQLPWRTWLRWRRSAS